MGPDYMVPRNSLISVCLVPKPKTGLQCTKKKQHPRIWGGNYLEIVRSRMLVAVVRRGLRNRELILLGGNFGFSAMHRTL